MGNVKRGMEAFNNGDMGGYWVNAGGLFLGAGLSSYEGKLFWTNMKDAEWYHSWVGEGNQILKINVNNNFIFENGFDVGRQFYYVSPERMQLFNSSINSIK